MAAVKSGLLDVGEHFISNPTLPLTCEVLVGKLLNLPFPSAAFRNVNDEYPTLVCVLLLFYFVSI